MAVRSSVRRSRPRQLPVTRGGCAVRNAASALRPAAGPGAVEEPGVSRHHRRIQALWPWPDRYRRGCHIRMGVRRTAPIGQAEGGRRHLRAGGGQRRWDPAAVPPAGRHRDTDRLPDVRAAVGGWGFRDDAAHARGHQIPRREGGGTGRAGRRYRAAGAVTGGPAMTARRGRPGPGPGGSGAGGSRHPVGAAAFRVAAARPQ